MTASEAKANQDRIGQHFDLGWWYGTRCSKCCGVYPKLMREGNPSFENCFYQCEVCGRRTRAYSMPWVAEEAWNAEETTGGDQLNINQFM